MPYESCELVRECGLIVVLISQPSEGFERLVRHVVNGLEICPTERLSEDGLDCALKNGGMTKGADPLEGIDGVVDPMHGRCLEDLRETIFDDFGVDHLDCPKQLKAAWELVNVAVVAKVAPRKVHQTIVHKVKKVIVRCFIQFGPA